MDSATDFGGLGILGDEVQKYDISKFFLSKNGNPLMEWNSSGEYSAFRIALHLALNLLCLIKT